VDLADFDTELSARGFDALDQSQRISYINFGYYEIARRSRWMWEQTTHDFTLAAGAFSIATSDIPNFRTLRAVVGTTGDRERKLDPMDDNDFLADWAALDLSASEHRGEPDSYTVWNNKVYVLPPPSSSRDFTAHYWQKVVALTLAAPDPITPVDLDEGILLAALIRCHHRVYEHERAGEMRREVLRRRDQSGTG